MEILISTISGIAFGIGAMLGVSICWFCTSIASKKGREEINKFNQEAVEHWKGLDKKWERIAVCVEAYTADTMLNQRKGGGE